MDSFRKDFKFKDRRLSLRTILYLFANRLEEEETKEEKNPRGDIVAFTMEVLDKVVFMAIDEIKGLLPKKKNIAEYDRAIDDVHRELNMGNNRLT